MKAAACFMPTQFSSDEVADAWVRTPTPLQALLPLAIDVASVLAHLPAQLVALGRAHALPARAFLAAWSGSIAARIVRGYASAIRCEGAFRRVTTPHLMTATVRPVRTPRLRPRRLGGKEQQGNGEKRRFHE